MHRANEGCFSVFQGTSVDSKSLKHFMMEISNGRILHNDLVVKVETNVNFQLTIDIWIYSFQEQTSRIVCMNNTM